MLVCGRQLEALWVLSERTSGMTDLLGHAAGQTCLVILAILAHVGVWQAAGGTLGAFRAHFRHDCSVDRYMSVQICKLS
jgi:hypothetical protein